MAVVGVVEGATDVVVTSLVVVTWLVVVTRVVVVATVPGGPVSMGLAEVPGAVVEGARPRVVAGPDRPCSPGVGRIPAGLAGWPATVVVVELEAGRIVVVASGPPAAGSGQAGTPDMAAKPTSPLASPAVTPATNPTSAASPASSGPGRRARARRSRRNPTCIPSPVRSRTATPRARGAGPAR